MSSPLSFCTTRWLSFGCHHAQFSMLSCADRLRDLPMTSHGKDILTPETSCVQVLAALEESVGRRCGALERPWDHSQQQYTPVNSIHVRTPETSTPGLSQGLGKSTNASLDGSHAELLDPAASVLVLLSGGVDSTLIAALADRLTLQPILLLWSCIVCLR